MNSPKIQKKEAQQGSGAQPAISRVVKFCGSRHFVSLVDFSRRRVAHF